MEWRDAMYVHPVSNENLEREIVRNIVNSSES